jgi:hypothetical protein
MAEGIDQAADAPSIRLVSDWPNSSSSGFEGASKDSVGIIDDHDHARGRAAKRLRTEIFVIGRFVCYPELGFFDGQLYNYVAALTVETEELASSESLFIKFDSGGAATD